MTAMTVNTIVQSSAINSLCTGRNHRCANCLLTSTSEWVAEPTHITNTLFLLSELIQNSLNDFQVPLVELHLCWNYFLLSPVHLRGWKQKQVGGALTFPPVVDLSFLSGNWIPKPAHYNNFNQIVIFVLMSNIGDRSMLWLNYMNNSSHSWQSWSEKTVIFHVRDLSVGLAPHQQQTGIREFGTTYSL